MKDNKTSILSMLKGINREGINALTDYMQASSYFTRGCYSHHRGRGGIAQHSLEVLEHMRRHNLAHIPDESLVIAALCHDLGKTVSRCSAYPGTHDERSLMILDKLGVELTPDERRAITNHHFSLDKAGCTLYLMTVAGDCSSTRAWKQAHYYERIKG